MIGSIVTVIIDRPLGSSHPSHPNIVYPINYGFIKGVLAPDGENQDAYILGVYEPVEQFTGVVIAIVHRINDVEDKWVVAPGGRHIPRKILFNQWPFRNSFLNQKFLCNRSVFDLLTY